MTSQTEIELKEFSSILLHGFRDGVPIFKIEYNGPGDFGQPVVNQGWNLFEARWHKTRFGQPVKNKYPRWARIGVHDTKGQAIIEAFKLYGGSHDRTGEGIT